MKRAFDTVRSLTQPGKKGLIYGTLSQEEGKNKLTLRQTNAAYFLCAKSDIQDMPMVIDLVPTNAVGVIQTIYAATIRAVQSQAVFDARRTPRRSLNSLGGQFDLVVACELVFNAIERKQRFEFVVNFAHLSHPIVMG